MSNLEQKDVLQRVNRLERQNAVMKYGLGLLLVLGTAIACLGTDRGASNQSTNASLPSASFDTVTARQFVLEDTNRTVRARLTVRRDDVEGSILQFLDKAGTMRASIGATGGHAGLALFDGNGTPIVGIVAQAGDSSTLTFYNANGVGRAQLGLTKDGQPNLILTKENGDLAAVLSFLPDTGPKIFLLGIKGGGVWAAP